MLQVRPFSAIKQVYGDGDITAYGGIEAGGKTATYSAVEFDSYVPVSDHPEYPSGSACFCAAFAESMRLWYDTDELNAAVRSHPLSSLCACSGACDLVTSRFRVLLGLWAVSAWQHAYV